MPFLLPNQQRQSTEGKRTKQLINKNIKNCSLSIVLTVTNQKLQKSLKRWYYPPSHCLNVNVLLSYITFLMIFAVFDRSPLTYLHFLILMLAVLLPHLCNVLLCNYRIYLSSFSILKIPVLHTRLQEIKTLTLRQVLETNMHRHAKFY